MISLGTIVRLYITVLHGPIPLSIHHVQKSYSARHVVVVYLPDIGMNMNYTVPTQTTAR